MNFPIKNNTLFDPRVGTRPFGQETTIIFKIVRFPQNLESFLGSLASPFHGDHFQYFRTLILRLVSAGGRRNIYASNNLAKAPFQGLGQKGVEVPGKLPVRILPPPQFASPKNG